MVVIPAGAGVKAPAPPVRLTRRGRIVLLVVVMVLLSLGGFWLGTRAAGHAAVGAAGVPGAAAVGVGAPGRAAVSAGLPGRAG
ncbi:hypothetical protein ABT158_26700 [Nonomuraea sp. NPDC001636]|uniref:hypothetical protein n=1 Tax=Nonomuraea sp. NPDC001636 TaxID=3154391 RepID=UPI00331F09C2